MRPLLLAAVLAAGHASPAAAQRPGFFIRGGASAAGTLVDDRITTDLSVKPDVAPTVSFGSWIPVAPRYRVDVEIAVGSGDYHVTEAGVETRLGSLRTTAATVGLAGPFTDRFRWRAGIGVLRYSPDADAGIFLRGGPTRPLLGFGLDYDFPVAARWAVQLSGRYDFHRFTTDQLQTLGFTLGQDVHRLTLSVGMAWGAR